jgi:glycerol-3-phosphate O-acyltransferase/dihydroxyacetone phosphate acyltransferase
MPFGTDSAQAGVGEPRANGAPPRPRTDYLLGLLGRTVLSIFYSETEVIGLENFPKSGCAIVVGNHNNSLIDAVIIASILPRMPRFLAASTVWDYRPIAPLLTAAGVVPLYRRQDGRQSHGDTSKSLSAAADLLAVFPEGKSHNEVALLPMKSGTARIALEAENVHGPMGLSIIPIGMMFNSKNAFRCRVLIEIGEPIDVDHNVRDQSKKTATLETAAARQLTNRISHGLETVTPNYDSWQEARLIE